MIPIIIATVSFVTVIAMTSLLVAKGADMQKQYDNQLRRMSDQINNTNYYNSQIDKRNIEDIRDVRTSYMTKDQISRMVDTKNLSAVKADARDLDADLVMSEYMRARKSAVDTIRADKMISASGIMGNLDVANTNASRVNLVSGDQPGILRFDGSGKYYMNKKGDALVAGLPVGSEFKVDGTSPIVFDPTKGIMKSAVANVNKVDFDGSYSLTKNQNNMHLGMPKGSQFKLDGEMPIVFDPSQGNIHARAITSGELNFDESGEYYIKKHENELGVHMPSDAEFRFRGDAPVTVNPSSGSVGFNNKFKVNERNYKDYNINGLSMSFDNKDILGMYDFDGIKLSRLDSELYVTSGDETYSYLELGAKDSDSLFMLTTPDWKGIGSVGQQPFNIYSQSPVNVGKMNISGVSISTQPPSGTTPAIVNGESQLSIYGKGASRNVNVINNLNVSNTVMAESLNAAPSYMNKYEINAPKVFGEDEVRSGSAFLKSDGNIYGNRLCLGERCADNTNFQAEGPMGATGPIGMRGPTGPAGPQIVTGNNVIQFGDGIAKDPNAGKMGYESFGAGFLDIVGAGAARPSRNIRIHDNLTVVNQLCLTDPNNVAAPTCITRNNLQRNAFHFNTQNGSMHSTNTGNGIVAFNISEPAFNNPPYNNAFLVRTAGPYHFHVVLNMITSAPGIWKYGLYKGGVPTISTYPLPTDPGWIMYVDNVSGNRLSESFSVVANCLVGEYVRVFVQCSQTTATPVTVTYAPGNNKMCSFSGSIITP